MPIKRNTGKHGRPTWNQAAKIVGRFGHENQLADAIGVSRVTVYRWSYIRPYGSDGLIPVSQIPKIKQAARAHGVLIEPTDWVPERQVFDENADPMVLRLRVGSRDRKMQKKLEAAVLADILK